MSFEPYLPGDFEKFWNETYAEAEDLPLEYSLGPEWVPMELGPGQMAVGTISKAHVIRTFTFMGLGAKTLHGWVASPIESQGSKLPAFLWLQPYGRESVLPNQYGTREGFVSLSFNYFGEEPFHREKYQPARGYFAQGIDSQSTWRFRSMFINAVLATRVLRSLPKVNKDRIGSCGMSQGGGMSIWLGAWCPFVRAICADMPFLGAMHETLMKAIYRYPLKELLDWAGDDVQKQDQMLQTISYFDTLNQAKKCSKPTQVSVGLKDPAVRPAQVESIYQALPGRRNFVQYDWGHDWHPDMVPNNRNWLLQNL